MRGSCSRWTSTSRVSCQIPDSVPGRHDHLRCYQLLQCSTFVPLEWPARPAQRVMHPASHVWLSFGPDWVLIAKCQLARPDDSVLHCCSEAGEAFREQDPGTVPKAHQDPDTAPFTGPIDATIGDKEIDTNFRSVIVATATVLPHLKAQPAAYLINVSSGLSGVRSTDACLPREQGFAGSQPLWRAETSLLLRCLLLDHDPGRGLGSGVFLPPPVVARKPQAGANGLRSLPLLTSAMCPLIAGLSLVPKADTPVYCATKAAVRSFTMSLRYQLREGTVRVIEIIPPAVQSDLHSFMGPEGAKVSMRSCSDPAL